MSQPLDRLVADNLDIWTSVTERKSGAGRSGGGKRVNLYGIKRLRALILDLAMRGKLVPQDAEGEPATALLPKIAAERQRRIKAKEIKGAKGPSKPTSEPFEVPSGWVWVPLWQTGNIFTGNSINPSLRIELEKNGEGRPFVATKDVGYGFDPIDYDNGLIVELEDQRFSVAKPNSVFICAEGGSAGRKMAISDREISFGNKLIANEPWSQIEPRYILYTYLSDFFFDSFSKEMTGIIGGISRAKFLALPFPLPPLAEQRRIVTKVDELMALCDALEQESADALAAHQELVETLLATLVNSTGAADLAANWARLETHFDTLFTTEASIDALKSTILDLAVRGKLVEQNARDEAAGELLRQLALRKSDHGKGKNWSNGENPTEGLAFKAPDGWAWTTIDQTANRVTVGYVGPMKDEYVDDGVPFLRSQNVRANAFRPEGLTYISNEFHQKIIKSELVPGDVIVVRSGNVGTACAIPPGLPMANCSDLVVIQRPEAVVPDYLCFYLNSLASVHVEAGTVGVALTHFNTKSVATMPIPVPPLAEQHRIVAKVDELMALCEALKARVADAATTQKHLADAIAERAAA